ncbi:hypothetical protein SISSUDRAFT_390216 [Sistotremastrum suecicum HHB10207 ss-3]|uniref:Uncharacterized protein n=1 Tax=Sistotremastrum suecicum HHB10207 ss-3 TaxID=1314776 RepID=A0A165YWT2_9AGAM|nr:hypothetical protein SISSUDRAFT_390216 [Sistotremastrum suecicum HHB10207 ss-3]
MMWCDARASAPLRAGARDGRRVKGGGWGDEGRRVGEKREDVALFNMRRAFKSPHCFLTARIAGSSLACIFHARLCGTVVAMSRNPVDSISLSRLGQKRSMPSPSLTFVFSPTQAYVSSCRSFQKYPIPAPPRLTIHPTLPAPPVAQHHLPLNTHTTRRFSMSIDSEQEALRVGISATESRPLIYPLKMHRALFSP